MNIDVSTYNVESVAVGAHHGAFMHIMKRVIGKEVMLGNIMFQMVIRMLVVIIMGMFMVVVIVVVIVFIMVMKIVIHDNVIMRVAIVWDEGATIVIADELNLVDIDVIELCDDVLTFDVDHCLSLAHSSSC